MATIPGNNRVSVASELATMDAVPGTLVWVDAEECSYEAVPTNQAATNAITGPSDQTPVSWESKVTASLVLRPPTSGHAAYLNAAIQAESGRRAIKLLPGSAWTIDEPLVMKSNLELVLGKGTTLTSTMPYVDGHTNIVFFSAEVQAPGVVNGVTTTAATVNVFDNQVTCTDAAAISVGNYIELIGGFGLSFKVLNKAGNVLTLDRRVLKTIASGATVRVYTPCRNVKIHGEGARVMGGGDRIMQAVATWDWRVEGLVLECGNPSGTELQAGLAFDWGGRNNWIIDCEVDGTSDTQCGLIIEGQIDSGIRGCRAKNCTNMGAYVNACQEFSVPDLTVNACNGTTSVAGLIITAAAGDTTGSCYGEIRNLQCSDVGRPLVFGCGSNNIDVYGVQAIRSSLHPLFFELGESSTAPHDITIHGARIHDGLSGIASVCAGAANITLKNINSKGNARNATNIFYDLTSVTNFVLDGWNFAEPSVNALSAIGTSGTCSVRAQGLYGSFGGSTTTLTAFFNCGGGGTIAVRDYDITTTASASTRILAYSTSAAVTIDFVNGRNPGWNYFAILGASSYHRVGLGVTITGSETFTAGHRTAVSTATT